MIACVIPTIREESYNEFIEAWTPLFSKYNVKIIKVEDGETPTANGKTAKEILGENADLIHNFNDGVRNLGFAYISKYLPEVEYILTLDDDTKPYGDTIGDHLRVLNGRTATSWLSTASEFMRGFPYNVRTESEIVLSHGIWHGVKDWDAPTQLVKGNRDVSFFQGAIPKGVFYPMCGMNVMFKRKLVPYMYWAPMYNGVDRFADIWCGIESKKIIDQNGWAVVSGFAAVKHERASDVFKNLQKEALGLSMNEKYGEDTYFKYYKEKREKWASLIK